MVTKTFKSLIEFNNLWNTWREEDANIVHTKFGYAVSRIYQKSLTEIFNEYNHELSKIRLEHALVDKKTGAVLRSEVSKSYEYDKKGANLLLEAEVELNKEWDPKEFEIEPFFCKTENLPPNLSDLRREVFGGLIINLEEK